MRLHILLLLLAAATACAQEPSRYFPERGAAAIHQRTLDLTHPIVVLSLALEPGYEDLTTLASLRLGTGARFVSAYATNGGATRSDLDGDYPSRVAARRREEAFRASSLLGGDTYFLNLPDMGTVSDSSGLLPPWHPDSLARVVTGLLRSARPDLVLLPPDFREGGGASPRFLRLRDALLRAAEIVEKGGDAGPRALYPLEIRCAEEHPNGSMAVPIAADAIHPLWKKSYRRVADEARGAYVSLRTQFWDSTGRGRYTILRRGSPAAPRRLTDGLPVIGRNTKGLGASIARALGNASREKEPRKLAAIAGVKREVEKFFTKQQMTLSGTERRVVASWNVGLDNLRCSVLNVEVLFSMPDSLLAESYVFFLRCDGVGGNAVPESLKILFPSAMDGSWRINDSPKSEFPLTVPSQFSIFTPSDMDPDMPASVNGLARSQARLKFPVIVIHEDRDWTRNYAYRRDFLFRVGPRRTMELLTPVVRVVPGERLVLSFQNFSRDPFLGEVIVRDSIVRGVRDSVILPVKDYIQIDTLHLAFADSVSDGDHIVEIKAGKRPAGRFLARNFAAVADTTLPVGLISGLKDSPVAETLRRMHVPMVPLGVSGVEGLNRFRVVVIDLGAFELRADLEFRLAALESWVREGGHLVILPQPAARGPLAFGGIRFEGDGVRPAAAPVVLSAGDRTLETPNRITAGDFDGWIIARTLGGFSLPGEGDARVHIRDGRSGEPLAASLSLGKGSIAVTSLDLLPQMGIVHPGAFRLLGNLLFTGSEGR
jgi:hypothetical protein